MRALQQVPPPFSHEHQIEDASVQDPKSSFLFGPANLAPGHEVVFLDYVRPAP